MEEISRFSDFIIFHSARSPSLTEHKGELFLCYETAPRPSSFFMSFFSVFSSVLQVVSVFQETNKTVKDDTIWRSTQRRDSRREAGVITGPGSWSSC